MALSNQQNVDCRRHLGYPSLGTDTPADASRDFAYGWVSPGVWQTLFTRLANLTPEAENTLVTVYLPVLNQLEADITNARVNLDTESAGPWKHNRNEIRERSALFGQWRRRLCGFLGIAPGPYLGDGTLQVARC